MRVLVCGGRDFGYAGTDPTEDDLQQAHEQLVFVEDQLMCWWPRSVYDDLVIITGGAKGVDTIAHDWAKFEEIETEVYLAEWDKYSRKAGFLRNKQMLHEGKPDLVIAFPGGKGTEMMIKLAKNAYVEVIKVDYNAPKT